MNREIKFRGKDLATGKWLYGDLCQWPNGRIEIVDQSDDDRKKIGYKVLATSVGQFTGLRDCNGKEIYEGDILHFGHFGKPHTAVVKWNDEVGAWCVQLRYEPRIGSTPLGDWLKTERLVCIGNIHDNPDLLKQE